MDSLAEMAIGFFYNMALYVEESVKFVSFLVVRWSSLSVFFFNYLIFDLRQSPYLFINLNWKIMGKVSCQLSWDMSIWRLLFQKNNI